VVKPYKTISQELFNFIIENKNIILIKILFHICVISSYFSIGTFFSYADETITEEKPQSIRELGENIQELQEEKDQLEYEWNNFIIEWNTLSDLVKVDLTDTDKSNIEAIVDAYVKKNQEYTTQLNFLVTSWQDREKIKSQKDDIIKNKISFYSGLLPYINSDKSVEFKNYIDSDIKLNEKSKIVSSEIERKNIERTERVEALQERIQDNKELLRTSIEERVTKLVKARLEVFTSNEWFQKLSNEQKIIIFSKLVQKIEVLIIHLEAKEDKTSIIEEKIILYWVVQDILNSYIALWQ